MKRLRTISTTAMTGAAVALFICLGQVRADGDDDDQFSSGNNVGSMPTLSGGQDLGELRDVQGWYVSGERNAVLAAVLDAFTDGDGVTILMADSVDRDIRIEFRGASTAQISEAALIDGGIEFGLIAGELAPMKFALELDGAFGAVGTIGADSCIEVPYERLFDAGVLDGPFVLHSLQIGGDRGSLALSSLNGILTVVQQ
jgi:hypothetical protein